MCSVYCACFAPEAGSQSSHSLRKGAHGQEQARRECEHAWRALPAP